MSKQNFRLSDNAWRRSLPSSRRPSNSLGICRDMYVCNSGFAIYEQYILVAVLLFLPTRILRTAAMTLWRMSTAPCGFAGLTSFFLMKRQW